MLKKGTIVRPFVDCVTYGVTVRKHHLFRVEQDQTDPNRIELKWMMMYSDIPTAWREVVVGSDLGLTLMAEPEKFEVL